MGLRRTRMIDVAREAGVSQTTASFVLNGRDAAIPTETRQRVLKAARTLGYRTNRLAQNLARQRSELIGTAIPVVENPFFASLAAYLHRQVNAMGYRMIFEVTEAGDSEQTRRGAVDQLLNWRVDGLLLYWSEVYPHDVEDLIAGTPTVFFGTKAPNNTSDCVYLDNYGGARQAVEYLIGLGHRRFCHLGPRNSARGQRETATRDALQEAGLPPPIVRITPNESAREAHEAIGDLTQSPDRPTAIICHNDAMALGVLRGLRDAGLRIPQDVSVVGYDDNWAAAYSEPPLTTVLFPYREIVDNALALLLQRMRGEADGQQRVMIRPTLIVRESTARPPAPARF